MNFIGMCSDIYILNNILEKRRGRQRKNELTTSLRRLENYSWRLRHLHTTKIESWAGTQSCSDPMTIDSHGTEDDCGFNHFVFKVFNLFKQLSFDGQRKITFFHENIFNNFSLYSLFQC